MRKAHKAVIFWGLCYALYGCNNGKQQLNGKWHLVSVEINGSQLDESQLDSPIYLFHSNGTFQYHVKNFEESGNYNLLKDSLELNYSPTKPIARFHFSQLDSTHIILQSISQANAISLMLEQR